MKRRDLDKFAAEGYKKRPEFGRERKNQSQIHNNRMEGNPKFHRIFKIHI